ncbi:hypothetical protein ABZ714_33575 [Streptomyces sp. NPDC006798]|uniref:hypothetical protein n=1 Tax=Streptomyces sp. NPDC006798 TaxID=3155462 RepID=UPI0033D690D5
MLSTEPTVGGNSVPAIARLVQADEDTVRDLQRTLRPGDIVLVKASRDVQFQQLADALLQTTE